MGIPHQIWFEQLFNTCIEGVHINAKPCACQVARGLQHDNLGVHGPEHHVRRAMKVMCIIRIDLQYLWLLFAGDNRTLQDDPNADCSASRCVSCSVGNRYNRAVSALLVTSRYDRVEKGVHPDCPALYQTSMYRTSCVLPAQLDSAWPPPHLSERCGCRSGPASAAHS